ncbi:MAG: hypothetical protein JWN41_139 [Thermoleophilia bacterium]|nr:hypothetical protein [Thermoleophilia bacterium]
MLSPAVTEAAPSDTAVEQAVTVVPTLLPVTAHAGETRTVTVTIQNQTTRDFRVKAKLGDIPMRRHGSRSIELVQPGTTDRGAGSWITVTPATFVLRAGKEQKVSLHITVPRDVSAGEHMGGARFLVEATGKRNTIEIGTEIPAYVFVAVAGTTSHRMQVVTKPVDGFRWSGGRVAWDVAVHNAGNVHETYSGQLHIRGHAGGDARVSIRGGILLPGESRTERLVADVREAPNVFDAKTTIHREAADTVRADSTSVFVLPWWLLAVVIGAFVVIRSRVASRVRRSSADDALPIAEP